MFDKIALLLLTIGGINWGLIGIFRFSILSKPPFGMSIRLYGNVFLCFYCSIEAREKQSTKTHRIRL